MSPEPQVPPFTIRIAPDGSFQGFNAVEGAEKPGFYQYLPVRKQKGNNGIPLVYRGTNSAGNVVDIEGELKLPILESNIFIDARIGYRTKAGEVWTVKIIGHSGGFFICDPETRTLLRPESIDHLEYHYEKILQAYPLQTDQ